jgi:hypothetical protein
MDVIFVIESFAIRQLMEMGKGDKVSCFVD